MEEEIQLILEDARDLMRKAVEHTTHELTKIRAGKAQPSMLDDIRVDYYGSPTPVNQVATVNTPDARTIVVRPFEKKMLAAIERAIINSDLGLNPQNDGEIIRLNLPPLTEERRQGLVRQAKAEIEQGKISIRNIRKDANNMLSKLQKEGAAEDAIKRATDNVQSLTDQNVTKLDELFGRKEKDIMTV
ncbi:ribosome recycling factor [Cesiribacter andamanensis]|uniref:Ribosome-recycling factor n=1 Tax=Cesiribacter andamanensis AMV16 TaxID=1279009 RepID=M7NA39_9BACT|nr:ribosome recycling factor [Cesiribacter andamanensis]EMR04071.1 Vegetative protein 12B [Cesiribacter andamanensis AMV16]